MEDDAAMEHVLRRRFEDAGYIVDYAAEGFAAIDLLQAHQYEAIVLDLVIHAGLNGFGVLNFLEMEQPELIDRVFLITGMSEQTVMHTAPRLLPRHFRKPFDERELVAAVRALTQPAGEAQAPLKRVLIVEDDVKTADGLRVLIEGLDLVADVVENGRAAIAQLDQIEYDTILLDLVLPGVDGFTVISYLQRMRPEVLKRTIVTTGLPNNFRERLDEQAVCAVVEKPVDLVRLRELILRCVAV